MKIHYACAVCMAVSHLVCIPLQLAHIHCKELLCHSALCVVCREYKNILVAGGAVVAAAAAVDLGQLGSGRSKNQAMWNKLDLLVGRILMGACCSSRQIKRFLSRENWILDLS